MSQFTPQLDYQGEPMQRFIALNKALRELPEIVIFAWSGYSRVWQDRPSFGVELHEKWSRKLICSC